jgi:hypothetical protein
MLILLAIWTLMFLINVFGNGLFLNLTLPAGRTLVIAASQGVCHLALTTEEMDAEPVDPELDDAFLDLVGYREWINLGSLQLSTENRLDPMSPYRAVHFGPEGAPVYAPFYWLLLLWRKITGGLESTPESRARLHPITVQDLIHSAEAKRWSIEYPEGSAEH